MPRYRIFPPIGFARIGGDADFFIGPEIPGRGSSERADGRVVTRYKIDDPKKDRIRKQAARFHIFQSDDGVTWTKANLAAGAVEWKVTLENRKSSIRRPDEPPASPTRPQSDPALAGMHIKAPATKIKGADQTSAPLSGPFRVAGAAPFTAQVVLGQLKTDADGNLLVLAGDGASGAPPSTSIGPDFYNNPLWFDDVADGPITATISAGGVTTEAEGGAWVVTGPPDFAPAIGGIVTMYDVLRELSYGLGVPRPNGPPSYDRDIAPIIRRAKRHRWVHDDATWSHAQFDDPKLRSSANADAPLRSSVRKKIASVETILENYQLRQHQVDGLQAWVDGRFDPTPIVAIDEVTAAGLTQAALEGAVGQGFFPGIEAGILLTEPTLYLTPFDYRLNHAAIVAGDVTALMAQPWQADFLKCHTEWWPSQRPDIAPQSVGAPEPWARGATTHRQMVDRFQQLGFIVQQGQGEVFVEAERDPNL